MNGNAKEGNTGRKPKQNKIGCAVLREGREEEMLEKESMKIMGRVIQKKTPIGKAPPDKAHNKVILQMKKIVDNLRDFL